MNFPALVIDYFRKSVYLIFKRYPEPSPKCPVICISCIWSTSCVWHKNSISYPLCRCWGSLWRKSSPANRGFLVWKSGKAWNRNSEQFCTRVTPTNTVKVTVHVSTALINRSANSMNDLWIMSKFLCMIHREQTRHSKAFYFLHSKDLK